jgi:hypothetical protein
MGSHTPFTGALAESLDPLFPAVLESFAFFFRFLLKRPIYFALADRWDFFRKSFQNARFFSKNLPSAPGHDAAFQEDRS